MLSSQAPDTVQDPSVTAMYKALLRPKTSINWGSFLKWVGCLVLISWFLFLAELSFEVHSCHETGGVWNRKVSVCAMPSIEVQLLPQEKEKPKDPPPGFEL